MNGQPYRFTGINIYTANLRDNCVNSYSGGYDNSVLDNDLSQFDSATGGQSRVFRAWFFQSLATTNGVRDWSAFDHTLAVAQSHGFRVIAVLANGWGMCEAQGATGRNGLGYRDISFYQDGYKQGPDVGHIGGLSEGGITSYRQWVQDVVSRYADNPTIFAWQLMNEGNAGTYQSNGTPHFTCPSESAANQALLSWATDVTQLVKSIDDNHLVNVGTLDNSCGTRASDNIAISAVAGNDLCDYHDYSSSSTIMPSALSYMITQCKLIGRPIIVDEMGINQTDPAINGDLTTRAAEFAVKMAEDFQAGVDGIMPWVWDGSGQHVDRLFEIKPGDPVLAELGQFGMSPPVAPSSQAGPVSSPSPWSLASAGPTAGSASTPTPGTMTAPAGSGRSTAAPGSSSQMAPSVAPTQLIINPAGTLSTWVSTLPIRAVLRAMHVVVVTVSKL